MRPRAIARQSTAPDVVSLPDVGRLSRQDLRQLDGGRRSGSSIASTNGIAASSSSARPLPAGEDRRDIERRRTSPSLAPSDTVRSRTTPQVETSTASEYMSSRAAPSALDLMSGQLGEREMLQMMDLDGPFRNSLGTRPRPPAVPASAVAGTGTSSSHSLATPDRHQHAAVGTQHNLRGPTTDSETVFIPDVGRISRRELERLEAVLSGSTDATALEELPDLRGMDSSQLSRIEEALSDGTTVSRRQRSTAQLPQREQDTSIRENSQANGPDRHTPPGLAASSPQARTQSRGRVALLRPTSRSGLSAANPQSQLGEQRWRVNEGAFQGLCIPMRDLPADQECAICFQLVKADAVALPCSKQSCPSYFHRDCIRPWLERNPSCPLCRCSLEDLVSKRSPRCRGCGGPASSVEALLTAMGLAELMGRQSAMAWILRNRASTSDDDQGFPRNVLAGSGVGEDIVSDPAALLLEALLQDSWTPADFAADFASSTPAENARARLEGADLAQTLGNPVVGQWQTAANLLGLPSDPDPFENSNRPPRVSRRAPSSQISLPNNRLGDRRANEHNVEGSIASGSADPAPRRSFSSTAPPGRWLVEAAPSTQNITQTVLQRTRPAEISMRLQPARDLTEMQAMTRPPPSPLGGGWRPQSRGALQPLPASRAGTMRSSASVPELGRGSLSSHRT